MDIPVKAAKPAPDGRTEWVIPKGDIVFTSPAVAGRLDSVWTKPDDFDPDRFAPVRPPAPSPSLGVAGSGRVRATGERLSERVCLLGKKN